MSAFQVSDHDLVLDALPDDVLSTIDVRDKFMSDLSASGGLGLEFIVSDLQRWVPGQRVRVAFLDGDSNLHREIMETTQEITLACNLALDFGENGGNFRRWTENDAQYTAEIRVSFDKAGYFSLVGTDSVNDNIGLPQGRVGGRPHQCSLNLGGFTAQRPATWRGTVRHEFLHALSFHHSHQNMRGPCEDSFRWEDDPGYQPTQTANRTFIADAQGRRPGIYTYLSGFPNFWDRAKVDHNLRTEEDPALIAGPFDRESVMLYRFPEIFYKALPSPCSPSGDGQSLSAGDRRGLQLLYPGQANGSGAVVAKQRSIMTAMGGGEDHDMGLEIEAGSASPQLSAVAAILKRNLKAID
jgi:hypothetical protein